MARTARKSRNDADHQMVWLFRYWSADNCKLDSCDRETAELMLEMNPAPYAAYIGVIDGTPCVTHELCGGDRHPGHRAAVEVAQQTF